MIGESCGPTTARPIVDMNGVTRTFAGPPPERVLSEIFLQIASGDYVAVLGSSGAGKSTLLNILGLLDRPTAGTYCFEGIETTELSETARTALRGRHIGFVFQDFHLLAQRSAAENVALGRLYSDPSATSRMSAARDMLERVGLSHRADSLPSTMSGGERQRVAIARALVERPRLLLCDEPTGNLDPSTADQILSLFDELNEWGVAIMVITHDSSTAARARRRLRLSDGRLDNGPRGAEGIRDGRSA